MSAALNDEDLKKLHASLRIAKSLKGARARPLIESRVRQIAGHFDSVSVNEKYCSCNVVLFHLSIPKSLSKINTFDITDLDHDEFEYDEIVKLNLDLAAWLHPQANIYLVTDLNFISSYANPKVQVVRLNFDPAHVMLERVIAMTAFVRSKLFNAPTVFVDSDAYLISSPATLFDEAFDVGLTHRHNTDLMPINEGVIYANAKNKDRVVKFFDNYLGVYDSLLGNREIAAIYTSLSRWRGGQLSINGACEGHLNYRTSITQDEFGIKLAYMPCSIYNNTPTDLSGASLEYLVDRCMVLHFKGRKKLWIKQFESFLNAKGFFSHK